MELKFESVARWLPFNPDPLMVENWIGNRTLYPELLPQTEEELYLEQAAMREELREQVLTGASQIKGKPAENPAPNWERLIPKLRRIARSDNEVLGIILDGLEPKDIFSVPGLALVIAPVGMIPPGTAVAAEVIVDLGLTEKQKMLIPPDDILLLPLPRNQKAKLKIKLNRDLRLNKKGGLTLELESEGCGVLLDLRGRPINLPLADGYSRERVKKWRGVLN